MRKKGKREEGKTQDMTSIYITQQKTEICCCDVLSRYLAPACHYPSGHENIVDEINHIVFSCIASTTHYITLSICSISVKFG